MGERTIIFKPFLVMTCECVGYILCSEVSFTICRTFSMEGKITVALLIN